MGLVGLVLARLGAAVYLTDKPNMTVHARVNAAKNKLLAAGSPSHQPALAAAVHADCTHNSSNSHIGPAAGTAVVVPLDWEDSASMAAAAASITSAGPVDLVVATDCIYPDPSGTVPSSRGFMAAVRALVTPGRTRVLVTFEARSDELRQALLSAAAEVGGGGEVHRIGQDELPGAYQTKHIEMYELKFH